MSESRAVMKSSIRKLILKALSLPYTSHSCKDSIATGNAYQTVSLGGEVIAGFRSSREALLEAFPFENSTVLDIGSNLGEMSRLAAKMGASKVRGIEYDALFVLIADLINLHEDVPTGQVIFEKEDVTEQFQFDSAYDFILAFSVFTYIHHRLDEVAKSTGKVLILETHNIEDEAGLASYLKITSDRFPLVVLAGESDWGVKEPFSKGHRVILACFKSNEYFWEFIDRCQTRRPQITSQKQIDLIGSDIPGLSILRKRTLPTDNVLSGIPDDTPAYVALNESYPLTAADYAYWVEFRRGQLHAMARGGQVTLENPYVRWMRRLIADGNLFDPGAMEPMVDDTVLQERCDRRLRSFSLIHDPVPVVFFDQSTIPEKFTIHTVNGETLVCSNLDGQHRIAAAIMAGVKTHTAYYFPVVGTIG